MTKELIIIAGPTGTGKSEVAVKAAQALNTEILSADSRQIYREMTIGTAIPEKEILHSIPHHFIQFISIHDYFNAGMYELQALELLDKLFLKHNKVIVAGGTGLYIDTLRFGIDEFPPVDIDIRDELKRRLRDEGVESLRKDLLKLDPETYQKVDLKNPKRIQKALEICLITGKPYSSFLTLPKKQREFKIRLFILHRDREELYSLINQRTINMIQKGLIEEARSLYPFRHLNALNTVGYKELFKYFEGEISKDEAIRQIQSNTRKYARKQTTWFRRDKEATWLHPDEWEKIVL